MITRLSVEGMSCDGCVRRVRKLLEQAHVAGVGAVAIGTVELDADDDAVEKAIATLTAAGYQARAGHEPR